MLGIGGPDRFPHHNSRFDVDEAVLPLGVRLMTAVALEVVGRAGKP